MSKLVIAVVAFICVFGYAWSGVTCPQGAQCPSKTVPIGKGFLPCEEDCVGQHGAKNNTSSCQANYCCKCGALAATKNAKSAQCLDSSTGDARVGYQELCDIDCKCYHGAVSGTCDYPKNACVCGADATTNQCKYNLTQIQAIIKKYSFGNLLG